MNERALLIAGPTAGGKSKLAMDIAEATDGVIVNADSMQLYRQIRILTARPTPADEARVDHRLYGIIDVETEFSTADWHRAAANELRNIWASGRLAILVGGTGLYFQTALDGLAPVPDIDPEIRRELRRKADMGDGQALFRQLTVIDPEMAGRLEPGDRQRVARALEVKLSTRRSLSKWQQERMPGALTAADAYGQVLKYVLSPPRQTVYKRIDARFDQMVEMGALDEIRALIDRNIDFTRPAMKALGIRELAAALQGEIPLDEAIDTAKTQTRRYAKRQLTWFRNRFSHWTFVNEISSIEKLINRAKKLAKMG